MMEEINAYRNRAVRTRIDTDVVERIGVAANIARRTLQALRLLDLVDGSGKRQTHFKISEKKARKNMGKG